MESSNRGLFWLPSDPQWRARFNAWRKSEAPSWDEAVALSRYRLDFLQTGALDSVLRTLFGESPPAVSGARPVRLAVLSSCTMTHLLPAIRIAMLRRGIWLECYEADYGQYWQELLDTQSGLHRFNPDVVLFAFDPYHLTIGGGAALAAADADALVSAGLERIGNCWQMARDAFKCPVVQQMPLPILPALLGNNEGRLSGSPKQLLGRFAGAMREQALNAGVQILATDDAAAEEGVALWHDPALWHRSKQEISPVVAPQYGDLLGRLLGAQQGRSAKCLVLDLDNTLWGGVIGDDGLEGIVLGQGSAQGEGFLAVQRYALELSHRGVILAVCSKNDEANAWEPFDRHPEMILRRNDIACFVANWGDKPNNIREVAKRLNIGIDSLVFLDDNPMERDIVRKELPMVMVPEVPDNPSLVPGVLARAGYFEAVAVTEDDRVRSAQYQGNLAREALQASATDLPAYLRGLDMQLLWQHFDRVGLQRIVQLINKTNQFNLTTRRYTEEDVVALMADERSFGLQLRLLDRFGDNGIIGVVIGRMQGDDLQLDTWLMSCRVLGRQVEPTTLNLVAANARRLGAKRLIGEYLPTKKNGIVSDLYPKLGFSPLPEQSGRGSLWQLPLADFTPAETFITLVES